MSPVLVKTISAIIMHTTMVIITKKIIKSNKKIFRLKNILLILVSLMPGIFLYVSEYDYTTIITYFFLAFVLKNIFDIDIVVGGVIALYIMVLAVIPDLLISAIVMNFIDFDRLRMNIFVMICTSLGVAVIVYFMCMIPKIRKLIEESIQKVQEKKNRRVLIFGMLVLVAISMVYFTTSSLFIPTKNYFTANIIIIVFILLLFIYTTELIKYDQLQMQNETLCECMQNVEEYQEQQDLKIHEYKNQLSKISAVTKDKKVIQLLEEILQIDLTTDNYILGQLKYIPKGDIKSLIYYKLLVASKQGENILVDVSPKIEGKVFEFPEKKRMELSQLLGIYFDNAIEAASISEKKEISLEIYEIKEELIFVIMNSYKGKVEEEKMGKKGFSTKGEGRGKGLYFAKKIQEKSSWIEAENKIIDSYYMQKLKIKM